MSPFSVFGKALPKGLTNAWLSLVSNNVIQLDIPVGISEAAQKIAEELGKWIVRISTFGWLVLGRELSQ